MINQDEHATATAVPVNGTICQFGTDKQGEPCVLVWFEVQSGTHKGKRLPWQASLSQTLMIGKNKDRPIYMVTLEGLRNAGWQGSDVTDVRDLPNQVSVTIGTNEFEGKTYHRIRWVNNPNKGTYELQQASEALKAKTRAWLEGVARGIPAVKATPPKQEQREAWTPPMPVEDEYRPHSADGDIPF